MKPLARKSPKPSEFSLSVGLSVPGAPATLEVERVLTAKKTGGDGGDGGGERDDGSEEGGLGGGIPACNLVEEVQVTLPLRARAW